MAPQTHPLETVSEINGKHNRDVLSKHPNNSLQDICVNAKVGVGGDFNECVIAVYLKG